MNLQLEIISPEGIIFNGECHIAVAPSVAGDIGFMHGHESVIALLREGVVSVYNEKNELVKVVDVKRGSVEMKEGEKLLVLVD